MRDEGMPLVPSATVARAQHLRVGGGGGVNLVRHEPEVCWSLGNCSRDVTDTLLAFMAARVLDGDGALAAALLEAISLPQHPNIS